jgi:hypothetical protein
MKPWHLLLLFLFVCHYSCAQIPQAHVSDSLSIPPGTVVVVASITAVSKKSVTLNIREVLGAGQGIINTLSEGQQASVQVADGIKLRTGEKVQAYLKEKLEADASRSSYELIQVKKLKS